MYHKIRITCNSCKQPIHISPQSSNDICPRCGKRHSIPRSDVSKLTFSEEEIKALREAGFKIDD